MRIAAVLLGLSVIIAAELICRMAGWGDPVVRDDPFVGFAGVRPLFVLSEDGSQYVIPQVRDEYFARDQFPAQKPPGSLRVFCLGGSTVQGRPWSIATSFPKWLELALNAIDDEHKWDMINCGGISYASYRLVPILEECLQYDPDLIILCTGHNEFLEDRSYPKVLRSTMVHRASTLRLVNLARDILSRGESDSMQRVILPLETEPILNFNDGLSVYHRDDAWRQGVIEHFDANVRRMVQLTRQAGVPLLLVQPSSNLRDCPPFKSEHRNGLLPPDLEAWESLVTEARAFRDDDPSAAAAMYRRALEIDGEYAYTHFELGRSLLSLRDTPAARSEFIAARDSDICPLRIVTELEERLHEIASEMKVPIVNMHTLLEENSPDGILGDGELVDHIHPTIEGHQQIADEFVRILAHRGFLMLPAEWQSAAHAEYASHLATLDSAYFIRGQRMLDGLRAWSQGRADGPPASTRFPTASPGTR